MSIFVLFQLTRIEEERNILRQNVEEILSSKEVLSKDIEELQIKNEELRKNYKDVKNQVSFLLNVLPLPLPIRLSVVPLLIIFHLKHL